MTNGIDDASRLTSRDILYVLFRHKGKMAAVFLSVVIAAAIVTFSATPSYRASAKLLVKLGRENLYTPYAGRPDVSPAPVVDPVTEERIASEIEIIKARDLSESVIRSVGIERLFPEAGETPRSPLAEKVLRSPAVEAPFQAIGMTQPAPHALTAIQAAVLGYESRLKVRRIERST